MLYFYGIEKKNEIVKYNLIFRIKINQFIFLANSRQLFPNQGTYHSFASKSTFQDNLAIGIIGNLPNYRRILSKRFQDCHYFILATELETIQAKTPSLATYNGSKPRISQALCT